MGVWNFIPWGGTSSDIASDGLVGNDNANGAVKVARSMYQNDSIHKVTSTLCYGVQWDAALNFINPNYINGTATGYVKDSTNNGNYSKNIVTTGNKIVYQQKHIYDMAGNMDEWTMEMYDTVRRVSRGGNSNADGFFAPASLRSGIVRPDGNSATIGFRLALYL